MQYVTAFITAPGKKEAEKISRALLKSRLIACASIVKGIESHFWWQGKIQRAREYLIIAKTRKALFNRLVRLVKKEHPYECPEIIAVPLIAGFEPYLRWIKRETL